MLCWDLLSLNVVLFVMTCVGRIPTFITLSVRVRGRRAVSAAALLLSSVTVVYIFVLVCRHITRLRSTAVGLFRLPPVCFSRITLEEMQPQQRQRHLPWAMSWSVMTTWAREASVGSQTSLLMTEG